MSSGLFVVGEKYRTRTAFEALRDSFVAGEVLTYDSTAYSRYDSYTGYFFTQEGRQGLRLWDVRDDEDEHRLAKEYFEEVVE